MAYQRGTRNFDTPAHTLYKQFISEGKPPREAAKLAQEKTGVSLVTGRPINKDLPYKVKYVGQYR